MANRNNGVIPPQPPPAQGNAQQVIAVILQAQEDPVLFWLMELPEPRKSAPEAVIWDDIYSFRNAVTGVLS